MPLGPIHKLPRSERLLRNAYRILGVPGEASWSEIGRAATREDAGPWDLPFLGPVSRTPAERGLALNRLVDPTQRLRERLFWFHEAVSEGAVRDLSPANLRNAMEGWAAVSDATSLHDAAVVGLITSLTLDPQVQDIDLWGRVLERWREVLNTEEYWVAVIRVEGQGSFEIPAPFGEIYEVREKSLGLVLEIPAAIARKAVLDDDLPLARRAIDALRNAVPEDEFVSLVGDLAERVAEGRRPERPQPGEGNLIPLSLAPRERRDRGATRAADGPRMVERSRAVPKRSSPFGTSAISTGESAVVPEEPSHAGSAPISLSAVDETVVPPAISQPATEPNVAVALPPRLHPRVRRPLSRPALAAAFTVVVAIVAFLVVRFGEWSRVDPGALRSEDATLAEIDQRLVVHDAELAEILLARRVMDGELDRIQENVRDYRALAEDYQRRIAYRLNVDRRSYARVVQLHNTSVAQYNLRLSERAKTERRYLEMLDTGQDLVSRYNERVR